MKMVRCSITGHTHRLRPAHTQLVLRQTQLHNVLKQRRRQRNRHAANISGNENRKWRGRRTAVISRWVDEHRHQSCSWWRRWLYICLLSRVFVLLLFTVSVCCLMPVFMSLLCCCIRYRLDISITVTTNITCLTTICPGLLGSAGTRKVKQMWILLKKRRWVAYASLHLAPDRRHHPTTHFVWVGYPSRHQTNSVETPNASFKKQRKVLRKCWPATRHVWRHHCWWSSRQSCSTGWSSLGASAHPSPTTSCRLAPFPRQHYTAAAQTQI